MKTVIDASGCIQLPQDLQAQLGVKPGDEVILESRAGEWVIRSAQGESGLTWSGNVLVHGGTTVTDATVDELLDELRDERYRQLMHGLAQ